MNKYEKALSNLRGIEQTHSTWDINSDVLQELVDLTSNKDVFYIIMQIYDLFISKHHNLSSAYSFHKITPALDGEGLIITKTIMTVTQETKPSSEKAGRNVK